MKKLFTAMMAVAALAATPTFAAGSPTLRIAIPYEFVVNGKTLPAGTYEILDTVNRDVVFIRDLSSKHVAMALADNGYAPENAASSLAFGVADGKHYLLNVTRAGSSKELRRPHVSGPIALAHLRTAQP